MKVATHVTFSARRRHVPHGARAVFRGHVVGSFRPPGIRVELQGRRGHNYVTLASAVTGPDGTYRVGYRFTPARTGDTSSVCGCATTLASPTSWATHEPSTSSSADLAATRSSGLSTSWRDGSPVRRERNPCRAMLPRRRPPPRTDAHRRVRGNPHVDDLGLLARGAPAPPDPSLRRTRPRRRRGPHRLQRDAIRLAERDARAPRQHNADRAVLRVLGPHRRPPPRQPNAARRSATPSGPSSNASTADSDLTAHARPLLPGNQRPSALRSEPTAPSRPKQHSSAGLGRAPPRVPEGRVGGRRPGTARRNRPTGPGLPPAAASNRACGSPAHGSPTSFTGWHTQSWV